MEFYFYNSYKLSHKGFQYVKVIPDTDSVILRNSDNTGVFKTEVIERFSNGGASVLLENINDDTLMFMIKSINVIDSSKTEGDRGYRLYFNFAVAADRKDIKQFCALVIYILTAFDKFKRHLTDMTEITDGDMSYSINVNELKRMCAAADKYAAADMESIIANSIMPVDFDDAFFYELIDDLYCRNVNDRFFMAVFDSNKEYFEEMNTLGKIKIKYMFNSDGSIYTPAEKARNYASNENNEAAVKNKINIDAGNAFKIALGAAGVIAGGVLAYGIYRFFRKH